MDIVVKVEDKNKSSDLANLSKLANLANLANSANSAIQYGKPRITQYLHAPLVNRIGYEYQDVNKNIELRTDVTNFYYNKVLKRMNTSEFENIKTQKTYLESSKGKKLVYNLLRKFIKKSEINWYDLRSNEDIVKKYLIQNL